MAPRAFARLAVIGDTPEPIDLAGIKVTVVEVRGDKVRLGIEADRSVPVYREEIWSERNRSTVAEGAA